MRLYVLVCKYILDIYFEGQFPQKLWNHYDTDSETNNNYVEGDNFKMNQHCNSANPNINKATEMLVRLIRDRNIASRTARQFHRDGEITTEAYIAKILNLYKLVPKKNTRWRH